MSGAPMRGRARAELLRAARMELLLHGFAATTSRGVCERSGANLRSIAYHFGGLRELLLLALSINFREWMAPLISAIEEDPRPAADRLRHGLALFADELSANVGLVAAWLEAVSMARRDPPLRRRLAENQAGFRRALATTLAEAGVAGEAERLAGEIIVLCDGIMVRHLLHGETASPLAAAATLARGFEAGGLLARVGPARNRRP